MSQFKAFGCSYLELLRLKISVLIFKHHPENNHREPIPDVKDHENQASSVIKQINKVII